VLAQVEVTFSNSMIEAFWRSLKHNWLYLNQLDSVAAVERLITFYVTEHNSVMPHAAFDGKTPDEVYFGTGNEALALMAARRAEARRERLEANRKVECASCELASRPESAMISSMTHLHTPESSMS
jgi:putative transposase